MHKLWIVTKNELKRYFVSPLAYVYLLSFLILNASFTLYFGDLFARGQADLLPMFTFQPWLFLLFIPGIAMRLWAEEFRNKTAVQIITMPVPIRTLVWGKFFAAWSFCLLAMLLTFPFWITVNILGTPDNGVIFMGYFAGFLLSACMLAIAETMSALTKNQVIALVLAVIANLVFFWSGIEYILAIFRLFLPDIIIDVIASFSFLSHFNTMTQGLLELRDIIFFISIIVFFNFTTILIVNFKTAGTSGWLKSTSRGYYISAWSFLLLAFFSLNILANNFLRNIQIDATEEKMFTLTSSTKYILKHLPEPVLGKLYYSPILEQRNPELRHIFDKSRLLLQKYRDISDGMFDFKVYNPEFLSDEEDIALADGLQPIPLIDINQNALFGLSLEDTLQNKEVIPFFNLHKSEQLEQVISEKLYHLNNQKKKVGILTGLPIFGASSDDENIVGQPWKISSLLSDNYDVVNIIRPEDFDYGFDVLFLLFPQELSPEFIERIKKFSRERGAVLLVLDPAHEASRLYSFKNNYLLKSSIKELEDFWHIKFYDDFVVADLQNSITVDATANYKTNPTFLQDVIQFRLPHSDMNPYHPITRGLNEMLMVSASVVMPKIDDLNSGLIDFIPLLKASDVSQIMTANVVRDGLNPQQILEYFRPDDNQKIIAAEVMGKEKDNRFDLVVISDSDFLYDTFWGSNEKFLENYFVINNFDNVNFMLNTLDYLSGDETMINLRTKHVTTRKFDDIEKMRRINSLNFKRQETAVFNKINLAKAAMQEVWNKKNFEDRDNFTADELAAISNVRKQLNDFRDELNSLRSNAYRDIHRIDLFVTFFNLWFIPLLLSLAILIYLLTMAIKNKRKIKLFAIDKKLLKLGGTSILLLLFAVLSVIISNHSTIDSYEGKLTFPQISENLNNIDKITFKSHDVTLSFENRAGLWKLKEMPDLPVYQERIRHFLTTVAQSTFFERKSNKAENLDKFNLLPIEDKNSKAIQVQLSDGDNVIQSFLLGDINLELGRGSRAAFIKFENQFQVWKIKADFVDMSLDWHNWTYSNLWNLRFGRIYPKDNTIDEQNRLLMLMKYMLNTPIVKVSDKIKAKPIMSEELNIEDGNYLTMEFYKFADKYYVVYDFDKNNGNHHLKLLASYLYDKMVEIKSSDMEKISEYIKK